MPYQATDHDRLLANHELVKSLNHWLVNGERGIRAFPGALISVIRDDAWKRRWIGSLGKEVIFDRFLDFVTASPLEGLGAKPEQLRALCSDDPEALAMLEGALKGEHGGDHGNQYTGGKSDNVRVATDQRDYGNKRAYLVERLQRERPDLFDEVVAKRTSAHRAAIDAGWVRPTMSVPAEPVAMAQTLRRRLSDGDIDVLVEALLHGERR